VIDLDASIEENIKKVAEKLNKKISEMVCVALKRDYNADTIAEIRRVGARVRLIDDGDVAGAIATCYRIPASICLSKRCQRRRRFSGCRH